MTRQEIHSGTKQASWEIIFPRISKEIGHTFRFNRSTMDVFLMHSECNHKKSPSVILFVLGNVVSPIWEWFIRHWRKRHPHAHFSSFIWPKCGQFILYWPLNGNFVEVLVVVNKKSVQQFWNITRGVYIWHD